MNATRPQLTDPFRIADVEIPNRVLLAPLAGIGNWFVRLQAKRHGAGLVAGTTVDQAERKLIEITLDHTGGNKTRAAELLGISLKTLHNKLNRMKQ